MSGNPYLELADTAAATATDNQSEMRDRGDAAAFVQYSRKPFEQFEHFFESLFPCRPPAYGGFLCQCTPEPVTSAEQCEFIRYNACENRFVCTPRAG